jgi:hypothetical protein
MSKVWMQVVVGFLALASTAACGTGATAAATEAISYAPPSAVILRARDALGGAQCGTGDNEVFKYTVRLRPSADVAAMGPATEVDCFADTFLTPPNGAVTAEVVRYSKKAFDANKPELKLRICTGTRTPDVQSTLSCLDAP